MNGLEIVYNFMRTSAHIREIGAAAAICGIPIAGWFSRRFVFITQVKCRDCVKEMKERKQ